MKKITTITLSIIMLASCRKDTTDISTGTTMQAELSSTAGKQRTTYPFKVNFYTSVDTDPSIPPTPCTGDLPGLANAGYFLHGNSTILGLIESAQSRGQDVSCNLSFATFLLTTSVSGQIAAANGDLIFYTGNDQIDVFNLLTGAGTTGTIAGLWTITGGTGKYSGASGSFPINGPVNFATGTFSFTGEGTITY